MYSLFYKSAAKLLLFFDIRKFFATFFGIIFAQSKKKLYLCKQKSLMRLKNISIIALAMLFTSCATARYNRLQEQGISVDSDFKNLCLNIPFNGFWFGVSAPFLDMGRATAKMPEEVKREVLKIHTDDLHLKADIYYRKDQDTLRQRPCLFYLHGGGGGYKAAPYHAKLMAQYAKEANCVVIMPDYHRLPKAVYPKPQQEMLRAYEWVLAHADSLGIDTTRIAVGGDSAGGYLCAILCHDATEKGIQTPVCQLLIYPGLDSSCSSKSAREFTETPIWNAKKNTKLWRDYAGTYPREVTSMLYRPLPDRVPAAYIETAEWDCLRDEGLMYAERLLFAGHVVTLNQTQGTIHGFDIKLASRITQAAVRERIAFLNDYLHEGAR